MCKVPRDIGKRYLQSFLIMCCALRVIFRGNSTASIPRTINVYVCIGSEPEKGGLQHTSTQLNFTMAASSGKRSGFRPSICPTVRPAFF